MKGLTKFKVEPNSMADLLLMFGQLVVAGALALLILVHAINEKYNRARRSWIEELEQTCGMDEEEENTDD